eukprot:5412016-Prymnesium_polylepis.1
MFETAKAVPTTTAATVGPPDCALASDSSPLSSVAASSRSGGGADGRSASKISPATTSSLPWAASGSDGKRSRCSLWLAICRKSSSVLSATLSLIPDAARRMVPRRLGTTPADCVSSRPAVVRPRPSASLEPRGWPR